MRHMNKQHTHNSHNEESITTVSVDTTEENLTQEDVSNLIYMYQEEKFAMDTYDLFSQTYDSNIFDKISDSEKKHLSAIEDVLVNNNIDISELQALDAGEFIDPSLQAMYNDFTQTGLNSYEDALNVGVAIEQADISDLTEYLNSDDVNATIVGVYQNLENGSQHHLDAFTQALV